MAGSLQEPHDVLKAKVCLVGDSAVGKTSLVRRYVLDQFDDRYISTLGVKVSKKEVRLDDPNGGSLIVNLSVWDIMGQPTFRELLRDAYFQNVQGFLAVADLTRRETLDHLPEWVEAVGRSAGPVPTVVAANKTDLATEAAYREAEAVRTADVFGADVFLTSAKTGANVEASFRRLAALIADIQLRKPRP